MTQRLEPQVRREQILDAALELAEDKGYLHVTRAGVAEAANCSPASVSNYFNTMPQLRRAIMRAAVRRGILPIIAQGLVARDDHAAKAPATLKQAALDQLKK